MCIRDSHNPVLKSQVFLQKFRRLLNIRTLFQLFHGHRAVSYTHLDVYKRQGLNNDFWHATRFRRTLQSFFEELECLICSCPTKFRQGIAMRKSLLPPSFRKRKTSVSYTHLETSSFMKDFSRCLTSSPNTSFLVSIKERWLEPSRISLRTS